MSRKVQVLRYKGHSLWGKDGTYWTTYNIEFESWHMDEQGRMVQDFGLDGTPQIDMSHYSKGFGHDRRLAEKRFREWVDGLDR